MDSCWTRIDEELRRRGRGWQWLADEMDMTIQRVQNWKIRGVPRGAYPDIAHALGKSIDWVAGLELTFQPGAAHLGTKGHEPQVGIYAKVSIEDAARTIAEALMKLDGQQRRSAEGALQILVSTPDQWPTVAALLRSLAEPAGQGYDGLGESPASLGKGQAAGGRK